jgi:hypothetical protein
MLRSEMVNLRVGVVGAEARVTDGGSDEGIEYFGEVMEFPEVTVGKAGGVVV